MKDFITVDKNSQASNPGNIKLNFLTWIKYNTLVVLIISILAYVSIMGTILDSFWYIFISFPIILLNIFYWIRKKEHFKYGNSNLGIVISINPSLVAVNTDLTKWGGYYPALKIITCKLKFYNKIGDEIPTIALYSQSTDGELAYWIDFNPIPIHYATNDTKQIKSLLKGYSKQDKIDLIDNLKKIPKPYKEGLYKIYSEDSSWIQDS